MSQAMSADLPSLSRSRRRRQRRTQPGSSAPDGSEDWVGALHPTGPVVPRRVGDDVQLRVVPLEFELWQGPASEHGRRLQQARRSGDRDRASSAVRRSRSSSGCARQDGMRRGCRRGNAAGELGRYIADARIFPTVRALQAIAGSAGGHPDVLAWKGGRVVAIESKGPTDALKASQIEWFGKVPRDRSAAATTSVWWSGDR